MIIKNRAALATTRLRETALAIVEAGIKRVLPENIVPPALRYDPSRRTVSIGDSSYNLSHGRLFVIGGGKASGLMAETLESIIPPEHITAGVVNCNSGGYKTAKIKIVAASHPLPDQRGVNGVGRMLALKQKHKIDEDDLVLCLISGGGSALMPHPADGISLADEQKITRLLLGSGAEIGEINTVRKHLSRIKGGQLGRFFQPATVVSLILSDVIGNDLAVIASGPTSADPTTFSDAISILEKYGLSARAPESVTAYLIKGRQGLVAETPKTLDNCRNYIIGDNRLALEAMLEKAAAEGLRPYIVTAEQKGETTTAARSRAGEILGSKYAGYDAIILGGETTPRLPAAAGKGGRNQHYAAVSLEAMESYPGQWVLASVGSDGSDFLPDVAGAIVDNSSLARARAKGLDVKAHTDRYDSNTLLEKLGGSLVITGATGTNVGDVVLYMLG